ncbi:MULTISPECIES: penicillin-binding protein 1C [unclassified Photobacterium]|uniref:penicillin-binding protein 1C n=1 Tax=unclassified Photobacterium TaxID=2628852 RepID=UPI001EDFFF2A|nr:MULTISPECIES: penicillin-binding protein 1C [unclassified Photobacterium]MCG3862939.1 penicillin-binding protein 1C [Photobacterium sp. Ph6]MCG3874470.1 penicillin-binding protein 1C [Photobacterium sp. Ph5]
MKSNHFAQQPASRYKTWMRACCITIVLLATCGVVLNYVFPLPPLYPHGSAVVIKSQEGEVLRAFADMQGVRRTELISPEQVDPFYRQALLTYEDRWFYFHPGFNPFSIFRAAWQWGVNGHVVSGGSTLTMQVARLISPHSRSLSGKLTQLFRALQLEWFFSKEQILTLYLNLAPFGGNIEGVEAAAQRYFGKSAQLLTKSEAALLVVLPQKPSLYRPDRFPERARAMRNKVLERLVRYNKLDQYSANFLQQEPVVVAPYFQPLQAPLLSRMLQQGYPHQAVIQTTIRADIQKRIHRLLTTVSQRLPAKSSAAIVVVDNVSANVIAYQGSADFNDVSRFSYVDMVQAIRSPGSTLKPFIYGTALDLGIIHSQSLLSDIPSSFSGYKPQNLNGKFQGAVSMSEALKQSLNIPLIQVFNKETPEVFDQKLQHAGIQLQHKKPNLAVGLGGTGTNLITLAAMYRTLATNGQYQPLQLLQNAKSVVSKPLLSPASSWIIFKTLSEISAPDRVVPSIRRQIAWKTGTSYGYRDFWSIGVSPDFTVGVWIGRPDSSPVVGYLGATQAAPIMFDAFDQLPRDQHQRIKPKDVVTKTICWPSGRDKKITPLAQCVSQRKAYTVRGITPPTLETDGRFLRPALDTAQTTWPTLLANWQQQRGIISTSKGQGEPKKGNARVVPYIKQIVTGQHYYKDQLDVLPLQTLDENLTVDWYVNNQPFIGSEIKLANYSGRVHITACINGVCDKREIVVHQ